MPYLPFTQTIFQGLGGFAIAQIFTPRSLVDPEYALELEQQRLQERRKQLGIPLEQHVRGWYGKLKAITGLTPASRTLQEDVAVLSEEYRALWVLGETFLITCGGPMSILGAAAAVACMGTEGDERYIKAKSWAANAVSNTAK